MDIPNHPLSEDPNFLAVVANSHRLTSLSGIGSSTSDADDLEKAKKDFFRSPSGSTEEDSAFRNWMSCCSTPSEAMKAYNNTTNRDREDRAFQRALSLCSTPGEARYLYCSTTVSHREEWARERIRELGGEI